MYSRVLINDTSNSMHYGSMNVIKNIIDACRKNGLNITLTIEINKNWKEERYLKILKKSDFIIVNGEGTMHSSKPNALLLSEVATFFRIYKIPTFLINTVYQNNNEEIGSNVREFTKIYCRDSMSQKELHSLDINSVVVPDIIFYKNYFNKNIINKEPIILYSGSVYKDIALDNYLKCIKSSQNSEYISIYKREANTSYKHLFSDKLLHLLIYIYSKTNFKVLKKIILKYFDLRKSYKFATVSFDDFTEKINNAEKIFTGYFHMTCFAILSKTPFISVKSNTHKIEALLNEINLSLETRFIKQNELNNILEIEKFTNEELQKIDTFIEKSQTKINNMFKEIHEIVTNIRSLHEK